MKPWICAALLMAVPAFSAEAPRHAESSATSLRVAASKSRTLKDVASVIDQHKGRFYALYVRALKEKPGLQGTIVLSFSIAPDGKVIECKVASSTLNHPGFEKAIVERFSAIAFGAKGTEVYRNAEYPLSFFSA